MIIDDEDMFIVLYDTYKELKNREEYKDREILFGFLSDDFDPSNKIVGYYYSNKENRKIFIKCVNFKLKKNEE